MPPSPISSPHRSAGIAAAAVALLAAAEIYDFAVMAIFWALVALRLRGCRSVSAAG